MKIDITDTQLEYINRCIDDEIESAKAVIALADSKAERRKAEVDLLFFEDFKKSLMTQ